MTTNGLGRLRQIFAPSSTPTQAQTKAASDPQVGGGTPEVLSLAQKPLTATAQQIRAALAARHWTVPGYRMRHIKPRNPDLVAAVRNNYFAGAVPVDVSEHPGVEMLFFNDDTVARVYFYFGRDSFESTSVYLWSQLARQARGALDIGSYSGLYSLLAARVMPRGRVIAFEPVPHIAARAAENAALNGLSNISVNAHAISKVNGTAELQLYGENEHSAGSSLQHKDLGRRGALTVPVRSLDALLAEGALPEQIGVIKIDTESDEINALLGGKELIERDRPVIFCEVLDDSALDQILAFARDLKYDAFFVNEEARSLTTISTPEERKNFSVGRGFGNVVLTPSAKKSEAILAAAAKFSSKSRILREAHVRTAMSD